MFPRLPRLLKLCRIAGCSTACSIANLRPAVFGARPPTVSTPRTRCCSALFAPLSSLVQWSVSPTRRTVCDSTFGWSLQVLLLPLEGSPLFETLRLQKRHVLLTHQGEVVLELESELEPGLLIVVVLDRFRSKQASRRLRCSPSSYHSSATMRKFCLLCDTIDDQRSSPRRLHDVDTCANDLRLEMAHLSQCGMSVLMDVKLRTTENKRACASNCAQTSTSL